MGHMHRIIKGIRPPTKVTIEKIMNYDMEQETTLEPACGNIYRKNYIGVNKITFNELKGIISTDLPGCFPITPARGNEYIFVMYEFDSNSILSAPIKNRTKNP